MCQVVLRVVLLSSVKWVSSRPCLASSSASASGRLLPISPVISSMPSEGSSLVSPAFLRGLLIRFVVHTLGQFLDLRPEVILWR